MPGIYGYTVTQRNPAEKILRMSAEMKSYPYFIQDKEFISPFVAGGRVHLGNTGEKRSPASSSGVHVWVEGEAYNLEEVLKDLKLEITESLATGLLLALQKNELRSFLELLDGYFCAAILDEDSQQVHLVSDRYGMRMLYWYHHNGQFAWSSEVKGILALDGIDMKLEDTSFKCFMDLGHLLDTRTWFKHIKLMRPATILTFDLETLKSEEQYYWKWSEIKPSSLSFDDAVNEFGGRFIQAVARRFSIKEKIGISLSGGLDSRAILAAVKHLYPDYQGYAYTFGMPESDEIRIAEQVISRSYWKHEKFYFTSDNWFFPRIEMVWNTDGMLDMMHMHGSEFLSQIASSININLNGYAGDAIVGGGFLTQIPLNRRANNQNVRPFFGNYSHLLNVNDDFYDIDRVEPLLQMNRVRRFTAYGTVNSLVRVDSRKPFFDIGIVDLIYSLPDEYRARNKLYSTMLQRFFPDYFRDIPWQKTGKPAGVIKKPSLVSRALGEARRIISRSMGRRSTTGYTDYPEWIRAPEVSDYLAATLDGKNSLLAEIEGEDFNMKYLQPHLKSRHHDYSNQILRAATIEIYFQRIQGISARVARKDDRKER